VADVKLSDVGKSFGDVHVLKGIDLDIRDGEFMVFVGPSGCGKSTLLRLIAGLERSAPASSRSAAAWSTTCRLGAWHCDGVPVVRAVPAHESVRQHGLRPEAREAAEGRDRSAGAAAAKILHIEHLLDRKPKALSGGQRQRVAIGRAIVRKPDVFLFDEPLSNLDAALRVRMRYEFAKLHEDLKTTMVYVTHDQVEAMTLADRIVVLSAGRIEQVGTPLELYEHPDNLFVAGFIGSPRMNFIRPSWSRRARSVPMSAWRTGSVVHCDVDASGGKRGEKGHAGGCGRSTS
jgi:multiple sugar transport system ATP-binding protein